MCAPIVWHQLKPYQKQRIEIFLHPERDPNRTGYNVRQAEIAVGSGGLFGRGLGRGSQSQLNFLPVAHTDFIFSGYAEATGFVGSVFLLIIFGALLWRIIRIAETTTDSFGRLLAVGITAMLAVQIVVNIGMNIRLLPVTGIPLPFISYGGTSLFVNMAALGIVQSVIIRHNKMNFATTGN
jgi:rod shape determining protein RodA